MTTATKQTQDTQKTEFLDRVIDALENGTAPWRKTWNSEFGTPTNGATKKAYNGWNVFQLLLAQLDAEYATGEWGTYKQWQGLGFSVKKGEKSIVRVGYFGTKTDKDEEENTDKKAYVFWKSTPVFNFAQVTPIDPENVPTPTPKPEPVSIDLKARCEQLGVKVRFGCKPRYLPDINTIEIPNLENFEGFGEWFSTFTHELAHATESLLGWERHHNKESYAEGELRAELTAIFLCLEIGVQPAFDNSVSYLKGWAELLKSDAKALTRLCADAQKAVNLIRGVKE